MPAQQTIGARASRQRLRQYAARPVVFVPPSLMPRTDGRRVGLVARHNAILRDEQ